MDGKDTKMDRTALPLGPKLLHYITLFVRNSFPNYYGAQNYYIGKQFPDYAGHLLYRAFWQEFFCVIRGLFKVLSVNVPITHINCLGINFPIAHTSATQKNCFRIICVILSGS